MMTRWHILGLDRGLAHFDREEFFEACLCLDEAWRDHPSELCQGLLYLSGGFYHLQGGNRRGACLLLELAVEWLAPYAWADRDGPLGRAVVHAVSLLRAMRRAPVQLQPWYPKLAAA